MKKRFRTWLSVTEHFGEDLPELSILKDSEGDESRCPCMSNMLD